MGLHDKLHDRHRDRTGTIDGHASHRYDRMARLGLRRVYRRIVDDLALAAPHGGAVLDIGTGPGVLLVELGRRRPDLVLTGVDLSDDMVGLATKNLGGAGTARSGDAADLPLAEDSFDLVVSSFSLHHWSDTTGAAAEIDRVLRPGGSLYLYDFRRTPFDVFGTGRRDVVRASVFFPRFARYVSRSA